MRGGFLSFVPVPGAGMLTSFESYDALASAGQTEEEIVSTLTRLAQCATGQLLGAAPRRTTS